MNKSVIRTITSMLAMLFSLSVLPSQSSALRLNTSGDSTDSTTSTTPEVGLNNPFSMTTLSPRVPNVLLVGDSTMAGLRWFKDAKKSLKGASFILDAESCRSVAAASCYGREQRIPTNAFTAIKNVKSQFDVVVLMAGTHNDPSTVESEFASVKRLVEKKGAKLVVLTLRKPQHGPRGVSKSSVAAIEQINSMIKRMFAPTTFPTTFVADWKAFSAGHNNWFRQDGIHLSLHGALALGWYVSEVVARVVEVPCPSEQSGICGIPTHKDSYTDWLQRFSVKYTETHCYEDGVKRTKVCERDRRLP